MKSSELTRVRKIDRLLPRRFIVSLIFSLCAWGAMAEAHTPGDVPSPVFARKPALLQTQKPLLPAARAALVTVPASVPPNVTAAACPEPSAALCGYVTLPLDRAHPGGALIQIYFEQYVHTAAGPAESAIFANFGGPGLATTNSLRDWAQFLFASNLDVHDLVLIDDRGRGLSGAIDCPELQHGTTPFVRSEIDCTRQLGDAASRYGSGDVAQDADAVRAALGYDQVDYFGASQGGVDVSAYATRYGEHLRSIVLDAPVGEPGLNEFEALRFRTQSDSRMVRLVCARSVLCAADHPDPDDALETLVDVIQRHPVEGDTHDASGNPMHIRIDEDALLNFVVTYPSGNFINTGEIFAAADALKLGDPAPLLRLGAEGFFTLVGDSGDPTFNSVGEFLR